MLKRLKKSIKKIKLWKKTVWKNKAKQRVSILKKISYAKKGFSETEYIRYQFDKNDYKEYISEYERLQSREINGGYKFILDNKLVFEEMFSKYTKVPTNYAWITDGLIYMLHDFVCQDDDIISFLFMIGKTVLKWLDGGGGVGTYVIEPIGKKLFINGNEYSTDEVRTLLGRKGNAILCEYITQSDFSASLFPYTTNTIRIVCAKEKNQKKAKVIAAAQRIGRYSSIPVDNAHAGGFTCEIDLETGRLGCGRSLFENLVQYKIHPDTNTQIEGLRIPCWRELVDSIEKLTNQFPYLNFVAWDVLLTADGYCIIEGNASSGCGLFQMSNGVRNGALGDVYRSYGIIK